MKKKLFLLPLVFTLFLSCSQDDSEGSTSVESNVDYIHSFSFLDDFDVDALGNVITSGQQAGTGVLGINNISNEGSTSFVGSNKIIGSNKSKITISDDNQLVWILNSSGQENKVFKSSLDPFSESSVTKEAIGNKIDFTELCFTHKVGDQNRYFIYDNEYGELSIYIPKFNLFSLHTLRSGNTIDGIKSKASFSSLSKMKFYNDKVYFVDNNKLRTISNVTDLDFDNDTFSTLPLTLPDSFNHYSVDNVGNVYVSSYGSIKFFEGGGSNFIELVNKEIVFTHLDNEGGQKTIFSSNFNHIEILGNTMFIQTSNNIVKIPNFKNFFGI